MVRRSSHAHLKRSVVTILVAVGLVPIFAFVGTAVWVHLANNIGAQRIEKQLLALEVPRHSEILDSAWAVSRFAGAGNGTQYRGALLLRSSLNPAALDTFYEAQPGSPRVSAADSEEMSGRPALMFNQDYDLDQPGLFIVFEEDEPTSALLHQWDIRGH